MKIKFGFGRVGWDWRRHQIILIPSVAVINHKHYYGYTSFDITAAWLLWGVYAEVSRKPQEEEE